MPKRGRRKRRRQQGQSKGNERSLHHLHSSLEEQIEPLILTLVMSSMVSVKNKITKMILSYIRTSLKCVDLHPSFSLALWNKKNPNFAILSGSKFLQNRPFSTTSKTYPRIRSTWLSKTCSLTIRRSATVNRPTFLLMIAPRHNLNRESKEPDLSNSSRMESWWNRKTRAVCWTSYTRVKANLWSRPLSSRSSKVDQFQV